MYLMLKVNKICYFSLKFKLLRSYALSEYYLREFLSKKVKIKKNKSAWVTEYTKD